MRPQPFSPVPFNPLKVIRLVCICWTITKLLSIKLWLADRSFPLVPVHDTLSAIPADVHLWLFISSCILLIILSYRYSRYAAFILLLLEVFSCLLDQNRWQPWECQFLFMLAALLFINKKENVKLHWQVMITGLLFFSGLNKFNAGFIHDIWGNLFLRKWLSAGTITEWQYRLGYVIPTLETVAAIALFFNKTRRPGALFLCAMHIFNLVFLGPIGLNINSVVWPWNLLTCFILIELFYSQLFTIKLRRPATITIIVIFFWWLMPWFNLIHTWDKYLSFELYSGNIPHMYIYSTDVKTKRSLSQYSANSIVLGRSLFSLYKWGMDELNIVPYPEKRIYKAIGRQLLQRFPTDTSLRFYVYYPGFSKRIDRLHIQ